MKNIRIALLVVIGQVSLLMAGYPLTCNNAQLQAYRVSLINAAADEDLWDQGMAQKQRDIAHFETMLAPILGVAIVAFIGTGLKKKRS